MVSSAGGTARIFAIIAELRRLRDRSSESLMPTVEASVSDAVDDVARRVQRVGKVGATDMAVMATSLVQELRDIEEAMAGEIGTTRSKVTSALDGEIHVLETLMTEVGRSIVQLMTGREVTSLAMGRMSAAEITGDPSPATGWIANLDALTIGARIDSGDLLSVQVVKNCLLRIDEVDRHGPSLHSVIETNPDALRIAESLDAERHAGRIRSPLHGVPVLLKDNIDTADGMLTTAGSLALVANRPVEDAAIVTRLRQAGLVILGKANMSEWAGVRASRSVWGWSARGGLGVNPHALDRTSGGSSSGSAAAVAAGLAPVAVGTETDGSIIYSAALCGVVGIKSTHAMIPTSGVVPVVGDQDTVGTLGRSVKDAAALMDALSLPPHDSKPLTSFCTTTGVSELRVGLPRRVLWGYSSEADGHAEEAVRALAAHGVEIIDDTNISSIDELTDEQNVSALLSAGFKRSVERYLRTRGPETPKTLRGLIEFNRAHADTELRLFGQDRFEWLDSLAPPELTEYRRLLRRARDLGGNGINATLRAHNLDALLMPTTEPAWKIDLVNGDSFAGGCASPSALAGYPLITVPSGMVDGRPVGVAFAGTALSEETLVKLAYTVEQALWLGLRPAYRSSRPLD